MGSEFTKVYTDSIVFATQVNGDVIEVSFSLCGPGPLLALDGPGRQLMVLLHYRKLNSILTYFCQFFLLI